MAVYRQDIEMLNHAISGVGDTLLKKRALDEAERRDIQEEMIRHAMLRAQQERNETEDDFRKAQLGHYQTMEKKADTAATAAELRDKLRDKQAMLQNIIHMNSAGMLDDESLKSVNDFLANDEHFGKTGIHLAKPPQKADPQAGQNAVAQAYQQANQWRQKASGLRETGAGNYDPDEADRYDSYADNLEKWVGTQTTPKPERPIKTGENIDATGNKTFTFATPSTLGKTPIPGTTAGDTDAELQSAQQAIANGKDPAAVKALYKKRTGKDFPQ